MTTEQAKSLSESAISKLMEALERGQSEALKLYLSVMSRFHRYSWGNILLIYSQRPDATHVAGFHAWLRMRRYVRKGEKGMVIWRPWWAARSPPSPMTNWQKMSKPVSSDSGLPMFLMSARPTASRYRSSPPLKAIPRNTSAG
jgi:hypothetical protein